MNELNGKVKKEISINGNLSTVQTLKGQVNKSQGGASYYADLPDKPSINGIELVGDKTLDDLNIQAKNKYATKTEAGVVVVGNNLSINEQGQISVETTNNAEEDNTKPMTSAGVYTQLGNINVLLQKI